MENIVREILKERNAENLYEDLMDLLVCNETLRWKISRDVERDLHREDVRTEFSESGEDLTDEICEQIVDEYEEYLGQSEDWHFCLLEAIRKVKGEWFVNKTDCYDKLYDYDDMKLAICVKGFYDTHWTDIPMDFEDLINLAIEIKHAWLNADLSEEEFAYIQSFATRYLNEKFLRQKGE